MFGAFIAKRFVLKLKPDVFRLVMDGIMLAAGLSLLWTAMSREIHRIQRQRSEPIPANGRPSDCVSHQFRTGHHRSWLGADSYPQPPKLGER